MGIFHDVGVVYDADMLNMLTEPYAGHGRFARKSRYS